MHGFFAVDTLANWIWQGLVVALAATIILRTRRISATTRYRAWWIALAIVLLMPLARLADRSSLVTSEPPALTGAASAPAGRFAVEIPERSWAVPVTVALLAAWCGVHLWRTLAALVVLRRAKRTCAAFPVERAIALRGWTSICGSGRRAGLVLSNEVGTAAVLGLVSPAIAVSPAFLDRLSDDDLDRIVVHEWAHVQRWDDWGRLTQLIVRALAGFHPAVWWINRQLHLERETACDDWAVSLTGSPRTYAACLAKAAALSTRSPEPVLLPCVLTSSDLVHRVVRLLDARRSTATRPRYATAALVSPALVVTALAVASVDLVVRAAPAMTFAVPSAAIASTALPQNEAPAPQTPTDNRREGMRTRTAPPAVPPAPVPAPADATINRPSTTDTPAAIPAIPDLSTAAIEGDLPGIPTSIAAPLEGTGAAPSAPSTASKEPTPWGAAADAGVGIGRGSQKAAVATAGFFTRMGKSFARSF